ncbi:calcium-translocating P-type ATPase, SERCA-type [Bacillus sporothermodurans]|uniref:calcium-translocating P-type ATPase, SERCA-type n=1 Tax=Heyndrickxia sporothermodurans TaxID=46224 RepID=UPI00192C8A9C|nr:calcium-translocating P-type ATPase, SERCA-type [Heyndrickxia sporothermodurans]MBL5800325.1 calcium-translocating P-type ATPase, SERCA-type [Heyndrickxia sporothermodurans]MBL5811381.1 calcium-translocating P-type ATPase, SERCA-type [Heyndrickxia sporothermodurans]MBL5814910.1 calcium-translocating P-type ATPase, SERCA-type [Heyndrickxia sporothermodurans]MBL5818292.1 calcium-translocating P-type ATPase, SERCA-type [Heyndrickxia sporothermodurans]MBL5843533.1 calcium-translocating P-type A
MMFHEMKEKDVEKVLNSNIDQGLSDSEVEKKRKQFGWNELQEGEKQSALMLFISQFKDFMVLVLLAATLISGLLGEYIDAIAIIMIVLINGCLGFFQERKAEKSLNALRELSAPQVVVLRNGEWSKIPSKEVVVGDILKFSSGDRIGADVRLVHTANLEIEESALTGESVPAVKTIDPITEKNASLGDLTNMAFMGTMVTRGNGVGIVTGIGMNTAMGKIADMIQNAETMMTPLQRRLEQLGKILITVALLLTLLVVIAGVVHGHDLYTMFLAGVSLAVAAIPEGLPAIVTVALSLGVQRMIRNNAIVRKLPAVETLGCASVICSDKTGTMTQNKMTVTHLWSGGNTWTVSGTGYHPKGNFYKDKEEIVPHKEKSLYQLLTFGLLCNHAEIQMKDDEFIIDGDPTEGALLVSAMKAGMTRESILKQFTIEKEFPFDSTRKMMSVVVKDKNGKRFVITKGAPDVLIGLSESVLWDGKMQSLSLELQRGIQSSIENLASKALRTIAVVFKPLQEYTNIMHESEAEKGLTFVGVQGMIDPPRPEVKQAIKECHEAGIKTVMITGDHAITAKAIAKQLGILKGKSKVIEGSALNEMSVDELENVVEEVSVFARVSPEHKLKIVKAFQNHGHIVAMTGDGVNDAPAIKSADIGIAMGITGTDVAKEASSLILLDDNFATIKAAIKEGRNIYENIRKFVRYLLASNVGEILVMLFAMLMSLPLPLVPIQILWVNLVTDGLPAMALGLDKPEDDVMKRKPRHPKEGIFARKLGWKVVSRGFLIGLVTLLAFLTIYRKNPDQLEYAQTVAFATLVLTQLIHVFDCRSEKSVFNRNPFGNMYLVWAVISSILLMLIVIYVPSLQQIFHTLPIIPKDWLLIVGLSSVPTFLLAGSLFVRKKE